MSAAAIDQGPAILPEADARAAHAGRQHRKAVQAYKAMPARERGIIDRRGLEPAPEQPKGRAAREWRYEQWQPVADHERHLIDGEPLPGYEPGHTLTDSQRWQIEARAVRRTLEVIIRALTSYFRRGERVASALLAVLDGQHRDEGLRQIAKAHGCSSVVLRPFLLGVRRLLGE